MRKFKLPLIAISVITLAFSCDKKLDAAILEKNDSNVVQKEATIEKIVETSNKYLRLAKLNSPSQDRVTDDPNYWDMVIQMYAYGPGIDLDVSAMFGARCSALMSSISVPDSPDTPNSPENPYEEYGLMHVDILHHQLTDDPGLTFDGETPNNENYIDYAHYYLSVNYGKTEEEMADLTLENLEEFIAVMDEPTDYSMVTFVENSRAAGDINSVEADILELYFEVMEASTYVDFSEYSLLIETDVLESEFTPSEKELLFMTMALARHDVGYWNNAE